jgi:hypothetical protein
VGRAGVAAKSGAAVENSNNAGVQSFLFTQIAFFVTLPV